MIRGKLRKGVVQGIADLLGAKASLWSENWPASDLLSACYEERAAPALWRRGFRHGVGGSIASAFPKTYEGSMVDGSYTESEDWDTYRLKYDSDGKNMHYDKVE